MKHGLLRDIGDAILNGLIAATLLIGVSMWIQILEAERFGPASSRPDTHTTVVTPEPSPGASPQGEIGEAVASQIDPITGETRMVVLR